MRFRVLGEVSLGSRAPCEPKPCNIEVIALSAQSDASPHSRLRLIGLMQHSLISGSTGSTL